MLYPNCAFSASKILFTEDFWGFLFYKIKYTKRKGENKMKKILSLMLVIALLVLSLSACADNGEGGGNPPPEGEAATFTLVIATPEKQVYEVPIAELGEGDGLMPVFEYLKTTKGLQYDISGTMINSIGGLENDYNTSRYIYIFTSVERDFDVTEYKEEIVYEGKTLVSAGVGFHQMTVSDGAIVYIGLVTFNF